MQKLLLALVISLLVGTVWTQNNTFAQPSCNRLISDPPANFETGSLNLVKNQHQQNSRYYSFDATLRNTIGNFGSNFEITLSIIYIEGYKEDDGLDFKIAGAPNGNNKFQAGLYIAPSSQWVSCHIHYMAAVLFDPSSKDFVTGMRVGFINVETSKLQSLKGSSNTKMVHYFGKDIVVSPLITGSRVFLSGITTQDPQFSILIADSEFKQDENALQYFIKVSQIASPIETLVLSFVLFSQADVNLFPESPKQTVLQSVESRLQNTEAYISGMAGVNGAKVSQLRNSKRRLLVDSLGENQKTVLNTFVDAFEIKIYKAVANTMSPNLLTSQSDPILEKFKKDNVCITAQICRDTIGGEVVILKNQKTACAKCGKFALYSLETQSCICREDYKEINEECVPLCRDDQLYLDGSCYLVGQVDCGLNSEYDPRTRTCQCLPNFEFIRLENSGSICMPECKGGAQFNIGNLRCQCTENAEYRDGTCYKCGNLEDFDSATKTCSCKDEPNIYRNKAGGCSICGKAFQAINPETKQCECISGYVRRGLFCRPGSNINILN